jgi:hypothetical protein
MFPFMHLIAELPLVWYNPFTWKEAWTNTVLGFKLLIWLVAVVAIAYFVADRKVVMFLAIILFLFIYGLLPLHLILKCIFLPLIGVI